MAGTVKKLQHPEGTNIGAPTDLSLATSTTTIEAYPDEAAYATANGAPGNGSTFVDTTERTFKSYSGGAWRTCWVEEDPSDATKLIVKDLSGQATGIVLTIASVAQSNRTATFPDKSGTVGIFVGNAMDLPTAANGSFGANAGANIITFGGSTTTVVIPGNLQVQGTTTQVDTVNMNVKDANILINNGGNDASAEGAGLTVERTGTNGSFIYEDALGSKFKIGALGSESEVITRLHVQSIENKRIRLDTTSAANDTTSPRFLCPGNTLANLQTISGTNHVGARSLYWATDVKKFYYWDGAALRPVGSGSGSGTGVNFVTNPDFEATADGVSSYDDGAVAVPINGIGGSPTVISFARNTTTPLNGDADLKISKSAADGQGEGVSIDVLVPRGYAYAQKMELSFLLDTSDANFASGDLTAYIYDVANSAIITTTITSIPSKFIGRLGMNFEASNSTQYKVLFHIATTNATAYDVYVDDVLVGPTKGSASSSIVSRWKEETSAVFSPGLAIQSYKYWWRQVGESVEGEVTVLVDSGSTGSTATYVELPNGWTIDPAKYPHGAGTILGDSEIYQSPRFYEGMTSYSGNSGEGRIIIINGYAAATTGGNEVRTLNTGDLNINDYLTFKFSVQVEQLEGAGTLYEATTDTEFASNSDASDADDTTSFVRGLGGAAGVIGVTNISASRRKRIEFLFDIEDDDVIMIRFKNNGVWTQAYGLVPVSAGGLDIGFTPLYQHAATSANTVGLGYETVVGNKKQLDVVFGRHCLRRDDAGAADAWSDITSVTAWHVMKVKKGVALGFEYPTPNKSGLAGPAGYDFVAGILGSSNIDAVTNVFIKHVRVGPIVMCWFYADVDANVTGAAYFDFQIPIPSNFAAATDLIGNGSNLFDQRVSIFGSPAPNTARMSFTALVTTATTWTGSFAYSILP